MSQNSVSGNPNLELKDGGSSKTALIVGLAVGIPLLVIAALLIVFWLRRARKTENGSTNPQEHPPPTAPPADDEQDYIDLKKDETMAPDMDLDELEVVIDKYENGGYHAHAHAQLSSDDDEDCVAVPGDTSNDESMVPDLDLDELHEIIQQKKEEAGAQGR